MPAPAKLLNLQFALSMLLELRRNTEAEGEEFLTYLLDMAAAEAADRAKATQPPKMARSR
ncbi:hypothetical protein AB6802_13150 [Mesorhizobium sp. RCC_202]|uniref:hypothetical protein n=1 Tax=Mesorhizobium sp. RCC_202 TaxID=3239222 RepID=UPI00352548A2